MTEKGIEKSIIVKVVQTIEGRTKMEKSHEKEDRNVIRDRIKSLKVKFEQAG